ncbi:P-loop domain-containing protein [Candidatus Magnetomoraceae bacterium gMMP-15]
MQKKWAIETIVPEEVYTDRQEFIDYFYNGALNAIRRRTTSTLLLGYRRMGKTEIFKRVVNRLFFEQDHKDPKAAVPVFFQFSDTIVSRNDFALNYVENYIRWYAAFRLRDINILSNPRETTELVKFVENKLTMTQGLDVAIDTIKAILKKGAVIPEQIAVKLPREVAAIDDHTTVVFLDEFQNTSLPQHNFSITGFFQEAVESPRCPHFVTGSAMSILSNEIIGRGSLFGRFRYERIKAFTDYYGKELTLKAAKYYNAQIPEIMGPVVSDRCGGNPFYITALVQQCALQNQVIKDEEALNKILAIDITSGFIWGELSDQVNRWIDRVNEYGITKWVLYLAALEEGEDIDLKSVQKKLYEYERINVPIEKIKEILIKLARGDLIDFNSLDRFSKLQDPILNEFLKVWGKIVIEKQNDERIEEETIEKFRTFKRRFHEYKGYLAEVYMIQILWNAQRKTLPGKYFHCDEDIVMPNRFIYIDQRHRPGAGEKMEVDIYATAGDEIWLGESKWWNKPVGPDILETFLEQAEIVKERKGEALTKLYLWLFSHNGLTKKATELAKEKGILWSSRQELDELLESVKLRKLPKKITLNEE